MLGSLYMAMSLAYVFFLLFLYCLKCSWQNPHHRVRCRRCVATLIVISGATQSCAHRQKATKTIGTKPRAPRGRALNISAACQILKTSAGMHHTSTAKTAKTIGAKPRVPRSIGPSWSACPLASVNCACEGSARIGAIGRATQASSMRGVSCIQLLCMCAHHSMDISQGPITPKKKKLKSQSHGCNSSRIYAVRRAWRLVSAHPEELGMIASASPGRMCRDSSKCSTWAKHVVISTTYISLDLPFFF